MRKAMDQNVDEQLKLFIANFNFLVESGTTWLKKCE